MKSKVLKWILGIIFIIGGLGFITDSMVVSGILMLAIALVILFPKSYWGDKFYDKRSFRIILSVGLFIGASFAMPASKRNLDTISNLTLESSSIAETAAPTSEIPIETSAEIIIEPPTEPITELITEPPAEIIEEPPVEVFETEPPVVQNEEQPEPISPEPVEISANAPENILHFILNTESNCVHIDPSCNAAQKIEPANYSEIDIPESELSNYAGTYWACGRCSKAYSSALPK